MAVQVEVIFTVERVVQHLEAVGQLGQPQLHKHNLALIHRRFGVFFINARKHALEHNALIQRIKRAPDAAADAFADTDAAGLRLAEIADKEKIDRIKIGVLQHRLDALQLALFGVLRRLHVFLCHGSTAFLGFVQLNNCIIKRRALSSVFGGRAEKSGKPKRKPALG